uniref:Cytochrome P450 n=1 Tax=Zooxanthella nutricula TaxID=1333877 RepID=A0A7S2L656_9DINO|mmetsp:Transcript_57127/g.173925  ORF Transcript_57127/g.173925 Transcript_57127/m.173925 type:complete len:540 (+) Transcript_57127:169-1788(+)
MFDSRKDALALVAAAGAGIVAVVALRRAIRREDENAIPALKLPAGSWSMLHALFKAGKDSVNYGTGRLILQGCDPDVGICHSSGLGVDFVFLRDPDLVQEVLAKNHQAGGGYGKSFRGSPFDPMIDTTFGRGLFFAEDQDTQWGKAHRVLSKPFSHRGILQMVPTMCEQADKLVVALNREMAQGNTVYMYDYMVKMALETIAVCSMGTSLNCFGEGDAHPFPVAFQKVTDTFFELVAIPPSLWWMCFRTLGRIRKNVQAMNGIIEEIVQKRIRGETRAVGKQPDLLDIMLSGESGAKLDSENIRSQILTFLFAGHDSTAAAMSSLIVFLQANPEVEAKLVEEVQRVVGGGEVEAHHLSELTYLDWCMKETLRLLPPAASINRMPLTEDMLLGGRWKLKRHTFLQLDMFALHMDPQTWGPDAARFVPERWANGPPHPCSYLPFAAGPRGCIGKEFSLIEQKIVAVKLLQNFAMKSPAAWTPRPGSTLIKACEPLATPILGIDAEFSPRQSFVGASIPVLLQARQGRPGHRVPKPNVLGGA